MGLERSAVCWTYKEVPIQTEVGDSLPIGDIAHMSHTCLIRLCHIFGSVVRFGSLPSVYQQYFSMLMLEVLGLVFT